MDYRWVEPKRKRKNPRRRRKVAKLFRYPGQRRAPDPYHAQLNFLQQQAHAGQVNSLMKEIEMVKRFYHRPPVANAGVGVGSSLARGDSGSSDSSGFHPAPRNIPRRRANVLDSSTHDNPLFDDDGSVNGSPRHPMQRNAYDDESFTSSGLHDGSPPRRRGHLYDDEYWGEVIPPVAPPIHNQNHLIR